MPLPRHLKERFNAADGSPLVSDKPGPSTHAPENDAHGETDSETPDNANDPDMPAQADDAVSAIPLVADTEAGEDAAGHGSDGKKDPNYARMEGRYKAQIRRLEDQLAELKEQARGSSTLADLLLQTREELAAARANHTPQDAGGDGEADQPALTAEEIALYGDFAPVAQKLIAQATAPLQQELAQLRAKAGDVDQQIGQTSEALFIGNVRAQVSGFDAIRNDPAWVEFLQRPVPFTTHSIGGALEQAHNARDLDRVVSIFRAFSEQAAGDGGSADASAGNPSLRVTQDKPKEGLAQFATPDRTAANPAGKPKAQFRESDYRAKLDDMRAGRLSKEQFMQFENDFFEAKRAGRVSN